MKANLDRKAKVKSFKLGDEVLVYLPIPESPLSSIYQGPYTISHRLDKLNYVIQTPDRHKDTQLVHINLMKLYRRRESADCLERRIMLNCPPKIKMDNEETSIHLEVPQTNNSTILNNLSSFLDYLPHDQKEHISSLLSSYPVVVSDHPGKCQKICHDIKLYPNSTPIRQAPYRLSPEKKALMRKEVDYLLEHGLAVPSFSPWASPSLLVPKEGGGLRFCNDYH